MSDPQKAGRRATLATTPSLAVIAACFFVPLVPSCGPLESPLNAGIGDPFVLGVTWPIFLGAWALLALIGLGAWQGGHPRFGAGLVPVVLAWTATCGGALAITADTGFPTEDVDMLGLFPLAVLGGAVGVVLMLAARRRTGWDAWPWLVAAWTVSALGSPLTYMLAIDLFGALPEIRWGQLLYLVGLATVLPAAWMARRRA